MKILVLNCGSSSIKYQLFAMTTKSILAKGIVEKIGMKGSFLMHTKQNEEEVKFEGEILDHQTGIEYILGVLISQKHGCIKDLDEIEAVGHRVVHGAEKFKTSMLITDEVIKQIELCSELAPLHNPPNLKGIYAIQLLIPSIPQIAVFDTAFHQTMPKHAFMYAIPYALYKKYGIRRYGFHGTSHQYVSQRACEILNCDFQYKKIITCHLGNGASITAIKNGESYDTSMGLTPVEGLIMGTRTGDLDLGVLTFIMDKEQIGTEGARTLINKHSGMLGISGVSSDMREIKKEAKEKGNERAKLALDMYHYRIKKYIGAYAAVLSGIDLIIFTGGIGERSPETRAEICRGLEFLGIDFDFEKNKTVIGKEAIITKENSNVAIMVIPTNEELVIATDTQRIIESMKPS
ncbi:MAG: acetate kinase [Bacteroidales bacterium]|nr:acetate kinase [Bacteroidales bacterium]